ELQRVQAHANLIGRLVDAEFHSNTSTVRSEPTIFSKANSNATGLDDPAATDPIEGGPKTAEVHIEDVSSDCLLKEIHVSPDLTPVQLKGLQKVVLANKDAFGLDGKLGNHDAKVEIHLKPGSQPVSLPPFPVSPANREIMDKQIDAWLKLGVIEPSKSPWGAPVFIVYRNGK
ncbi:hypothetical protein K435DRAFT_605529, partial [Dendrothele bispora CBS 962.96]